MVKHLVKRQGHQEEYDERKVYASVYASALNAHLDDLDAENLAEQVSKFVSDWIKQREFCRSDDIREHIIGSLESLGKKEVATMYKHHLEIC